MAAIAWTISDVGTSGGIVATPLGVQEGGQIVAKSAGIEIIHLDADSTTSDYVLKFLDKVFLGASSELRVADTFTAEIEVSRPDKRAL